MEICKIKEYPEILSVQTDDGWVLLPKSCDNVWELGDISIEVIKKAGHLEFYLKASNTPVRRITARWKSHAGPGVRILGDHWERGYGDLEWRGIVPERVMPWYFLVHDGYLTHGIGVKTGPNSMCFWQMNSKGITLCMDVRCGGLGVLLSGRRLHAATVVGREGRENESSFEAAGEFCRLLCENPVLPAQPVYGGNNWYYAYGRSSYDEILRDSDFISSHSPIAGNRPFMVIDDGWQQCHNRLTAGGPWNAGNYLFPDMQGLARRMKETGARPGIWIRPLMTCEKIPESWKLPGGRFKYQENDLFLDPSIPEVLELVGRDIGRLASWGYELVKHDFSTYDILGRWGFEMKDELTNDSWSFADRSKTTAEVITGLYGAIRKAAGNILVLGCNTVAHLAAGFFEIQRTGDDTSGIQWERTRKMGVNTLAFRMSQHNNFFSADADCAPVTDKIPWELAEQWLRLLASSGTPLFVSASPDFMGPQQKEAIKQAFEIASRFSPPGEPLDWMDSTCPEKWKLNGEAVTFDWYFKEGFCQTI